jgi:hypothetical protein
MHFILAFLLFPRFKPPSDVRLFRWYSLEFPALGRKQSPPPSARRKALRKRRIVNRP